MASLGWLAQPAVLPWLALGFGLCVGSFLNVVIHRLPKMMEREWREECAEPAGQPPPQEPPRRPADAAAQPGRPALALPELRARHHRAGKYSARQLGRAPRQVLEMRLSHQRALSAGGAPRRHRRGLLR